MTAVKAPTRTIPLIAADPKIQPRTVKGWYQSWRWAFLIATQLVFYGVPWLTWNGRQAVLFDIEARRFFFGGLVLVPQDFIYLTGLLVLSAYGLFLFTAVAGRLWCGYTCPQTVYTEMFMWVERRFEGDRIARQRLDASSWTLNKLWRRGGKHGAWLALAAATGFTFVGYFTPIRELAAEVGSGSLGPWEAFWIGLYSLATYGNAGWLREQVCRYMCPYARFQSAMFDRDTLIITYDTQRGELRGSRPKSLGHAELPARGLGECIDCGLCVQVCPTGIDIRKGLQADCIACAACIDVCNDVMTRVNYPKGLIRYDTQNGLAERLTRSQIWRRALRPRVLIYSSVLLLIAGAWVASLWWRPDFRVDVVRDRAALARMVDNGAIENVYRLQVLNSTEAPQRYRVEVSGLAGASLTAAVDATVEPLSYRSVPVAVRLDAASVQAKGAGVHPLSFRVTKLGAGGLPEPGTTREEASTFVLPR